MTIVRSGSTGKGTHAPAPYRWLIVPVKPWAEAKSRLGTALSGSERAALSRTMLARVLDAAQRSKLFGGVVVVSRDAEVLAFAEASGATALAEIEAGLNEALEQARRFVIERGADALLVLPSDLPLVTPQEIGALLAAAQDKPVAIAPSRDGGTNALLLQPPALESAPLRFEFGEQSFRRHQAQAEARGLAYTVIRSELLALDVDWPEDLLALADTL
jgi:2-phospho-L-lactate guanylyltransferase